MFQGEQQALSQKEFYLEAGLETFKKNSNYVKSFGKTSFQVGMDMKVVQKQDRDDKVQENYPTTEFFLEK